MPNNIVLEIYYNSEWHDLILDEQVFTDAPIVITRGDGAESSSFRPAMLSARLDNRDDIYRPSNPESPLYGLVGRNTPLRVSVDGDSRGEFEITSWKPDQTRDFRRRPLRGKAWTDIEGGGLLERINNWKDAIRSPFYIYNTTEVSSAVGYWSCEEKKGAQTLTSAVPGGTTTVLRGCSFDGQSFPAGSAPVMDLSISASAAVQGFFAPHTTGGNAGWQVSWAVLHNKIDPVGDYSTILQLRTDDDGYVIVNRGDSNRIQLQVYTATLFADPALLDIDDALPSVSSAIWALYVLRASRSGSTVTMTLFRMLETETSFTQLLSGTYSSTLSKLKRWQMSTGLDDFAISAGHILGVVGQTDDLTDSARCTAFLGYPNELSAVRFARLCDLKGVPYFIRGDYTKSAPMGPQRAGTLAELFREIRDTEDGLIFDDASGRYVIFTVRDGRYNLTSCSIDVTELPSAPVEVTDDLGIHNLITIQNRNGGEATAEDTTGPLGTDPSPLGIGEYEFTLEVNIDDDSLLPQHANWWLKRGTVELPRYPKVAINLANLSLARRLEISDIDIGDVIEITGWRENTIRLFVIGYTETIGWPNSWIITFTCAPDQQFDIGTYGESGDQRRYGIRTAITEAELSAVATTLVCSITDDEQFSATNAYDVFIAGERIHVPIGGAGARTGSLGAYSQTLTGVTRNVNGIRKILPASSPVTIAEQGRYGL